jgi:hypothetical protein
VADHGHRLLRLGEGRDERDRVLVAAQLVGIADSAGDQQRVVVVGGDLLDGLVDRDLVGRFEVVEALDLAVVDRDDPVVAPASSSAFRGSTSSTSSNMSAARMATLLPSSFLSMGSPFLVWVSNRVPPTRR